MTLCYSRAYEGHFVERRSAPTGSRDRGDGTEDGGGHLLKLHDQRREKFAISTIRVPGGDGTSRSVNKKVNWSGSSAENTAGQLTGSSSSTLAIQIGVEVQHWRIVPSNHHALQREFLWRQWVFEIKAHVRIPLLDGGDNTGRRKVKVGRITAIKLDVEAAAVDAHGRSAKALTHAV